MTISTIATRNGSLSKLSENGPYNTEGSTALAVPENLQPAFKEHYSLCRCGASKNKPYCDGGGHHDMGFTDDES